MSTESRLNIINEGRMPIYPYEETNNKENANEQDYSKEKENGK